MNLLPKCHEEFSKEDYWNTFFKKRGKKTFEWYGEYPQLCGQLSKYVKVKDEILVVGCGNSKLSMDLYDVGYRSIKSIDISKIVIDQMIEQNRVDRPNLVFNKMDATQMTYSDDTFSVIIDKGTLDALMSNNDEETLTKIDKYFNEISRVLRRGGRYICISLLQEHILRKLISYFTSSHFMFRITRCQDAEIKAKEEDGSSFPVFIVMATKFPGLSQQVLELALTGDHISKVSNTEELINAILAVQQSNIVCNRLQKRSIADVGEITLDLFSPENDKPRYIIHVLDRPKGNGKSYAVFLVPQGRDSDWLFGTKEGRKEFAELMEKDRIAIVILGRNHTFKNWDEVKEELNYSVKNLAPSGLPSNSTIAYLSLGADVGKCEILHEEESKINGRIAIEDVYSDNHDLKFRRLIFLKNQFVIQSDAKVKSIKTRRGKIKDIIDHGYLACEHHAFMLIGVQAMIGSNTKRNQCKEILVIGLGGGGLCMFLYRCFPQSKITAIEIDETVLKIAKEYFNFIIDERSKVEICDGINYLEDAAKNGKKFDAILFDISTNDKLLGISCPPIEFLKPSVLSSVSKCLNKDGFFILSLVCRDKNLRPEILNDLKKTFSSITSIQIKDIINEILFCTVSKKNPDDWKDIWNNAKEIFKQTLEKYKLSIKNDTETSEFLQHLTIEL
ncbi:eEF1A lysine and N-terminal methyltransferase homolog [Microplitis demolitor]|uniref:eEF1A lysine and N-terminal methyltransferase homolog n=1 Tax=Microplitis demolitor TaxID=69319 RepID=UPI0004CCF357|nr:eEF1A lysine and N-terminal methyltransferase homolog [Microplitis demolitor]